MAMKVKEIKELLTSKYGFEQEDISGKSKKELVKLLDIAQNTTTTLNSATISETPCVLGTPIEETVPADGEPSIVRPTDFGWTKFVMTQFDASELEQGMPRVDGLRRVAELLFGPFNTQVVVHQVPVSSNQNRATVMVSIQFDNGRRHDAAADVCMQNTDAKFAVHPVATAETRAEGRALRKALKLLKVLSAEEMNATNPEQVDLTTTKVQEDMLSALKTMCKGLGIDPFKLAVTIAPTISVLEELNILDFKTIIVKINEFRSDVTKIPSNIKE